MYVFHYTCTRILVCVLIVQYSEETTVYVTNIPFNANEEQLQKIFQEASHTYMFESRAEGMYMYIIIGWRS